jgi:hypothetical protein
MLAAANRRIESMIRLVTAAVLLLAALAPAFACELNSASSNSNETAQSSGASHNAGAHKRS